MGAVLWERDHARHGAFHATVLNRCHLQRRLDARAVQLAVPRKALDAFELAGQCDFAAAEVRFEAFFDRKARGLARKQLGAEFVKGQGWRRIRRGLRDFCWCVLRGGAHVLNVVEFVFRCNALFILVIAVDVIIEPGDIGIVFAFGSRARMDERLKIRLQPFVQGVWIGRDDLDQARERVDFDFEVFRVRSPAIEQVRHVCVVENQVHLLSARLAQERDSRGAQVHVDQLGVCRVQHLKASLGGGDRMGAHLKPHVEAGVLHSKVRLQSQLATDAAQTSRNLKRKAGRRAGDFVASRPCF